MTIIQSPATYNFAGNIPDLIVDTTEQLSFTLSRGGTQIVAETYTPAQNDRIVINLRNLLELLVEVPGYEEVATPIAQYTYTLGSTTGTFYCLPGGHGAAVSAESFLRGNFLTWQPQTRVTLYHTPHRLRYAALAACVCKVKGYFTDGTSAVISLLTMSAGNIYTMDVSFGTIRGKFDTQPTYYDVWVENTMGQAMTWGQRYMLADFEAGTNDYFIFANSLGGFDTIRFSGDRKEINKLESVNAIFDDQTLEYDIDRTRSWKKYTGYIADERLRMWVLDFFNSPQRYHLTDSGALQRIYVSEPKLEDTAGETAGYEFTYAYSRQSRYINLERTETPQLLEITDPASEVFFLAPRLNQFEAADPASSADYLIPIQAAAADKWLAISLASLLDYIKPTGIDVDALQDYLTDHKYATQAWVFQQNFLTTAALDNYLLKSVWDEVFEVTTVNGVRVLNVKLDIAGLKGITAYADGSLSGSGASGSLGELVNVGQWADAVPTADRVMVQLAGATHWSAKPLADLVGLDTAALAQYLTANSYLKASDISSYLTWANLSGKPTVYPTSWELVVGRPTKLSDLTDDVVAGNYLPKSTWDAVFEVVTVDGTPALKVKYDILGLKGITAYAEGSLSGGFSGALVDLVDVAVTNLASGDILKYNGTHFVNVPVSSIAGASSWDQITGKPEYYPTRWADVSGAPTSLPASDVYPWAKAASKPTYTAAEVGALALSGGVLAGDVYLGGGLAIRDNTASHSNVIGLLNTGDGTFFTAVGSGNRRMVLYSSVDLYRDNGSTQYRIYDSSNFNPSSKLDKSVWDEAFELKTVNGVRVISAKLDFLSVAGISAYATGPSSGGGGGGLDYDLLKQALTGAITPDGYPFTISALFLGAIDKTYLTGKLANTYANKVHTHLWADITDRPTALPANGGNAESAIKDGNGNVIANTYLPLTGNKTITGSLTVANGFTSGIMKCQTGAYPQLQFEQTNTGVTSILFVHTNNALIYRPVDPGSDYTVYHSGNFNPDSKLGVSSVAVEAKKMSYQGLMTAISGTTTFPAGLYLYGVYNNGYPVTYGNLLRVGGSGLGEMLFGWAGDASVGGLYYRSKRDVAATAWSSWCKLWTSANFNPGNYLLLSGGTMTGDITFESNGRSLRGSDGGNIAGVLYDTPNARYVTAIGTGSRRLILVSPASIYRGAGGVAENYMIYDSGNSNLSSVDWSANNLNAAANLDVAGQAYVSGWLRSRGNVGWYSQDYGGGIHMTDSTWVRVYGSKGLMIDTGTSPINMGQLQIACSAEASIGFRSASNGNWCLGKGVSSVGSGFGLYNAVTNRVAFQIASATDAASFASSITAAGTIVSMSTVESRGNDSTGILPQMLWHLPGVSYTRIRMASNGGLHILNGGSEAYQNLYAQNLTANNTVTATKLVIGGITIDVYNGALRVNGNLVATGGVTAYQ